MIYYTMQHHIPEDCNLQVHCHENLRIWLTQESKLNFTQISSAVRHSQVGFKLNSEMADQPRWFSMFIRCESFASYTKLNLCDDIQTTNVKLIEICVGDQTRGQAGVTSHYALNLKTYSCHTYSLPGVYAKWHAFQYIWESLPVSESDILKSDATFTWPFWRWFQHNSLLPLMFQALQTSDHSTAVQYHLLQHTKALHSAHTHCVSVCPIWL